MADNSVNFSFNWKEKSNSARMNNQNLNKVYYSTATLNLNHSNGFNRNDFAENPSIVDLDEQARCDKKLKSLSYGPDFRFINPAIYVESLNTENEEKEITPTNIRAGIDPTNNKAKILDNGDGKDWRFVEVDNFDGAKKTVDMLSNLSLKEAIASSTGDHDGTTDEIISPETYRCYFSTSSAASSIDAYSARQSKSVVNVKPVSQRVERRCRIDNDSTITRNQRRSFSSNSLVLGEKDQPAAEVQRYILNGHRVMHISTTTIASSNVSQIVDEPYLARKNAHEEWLRKKQIYLQQKKEKEDIAKTKVREQEERLEREKEEKERREKENFVKWTERKKKEEADKKATLEREMKMEEQLKGLEEKTVIAKALCLRKWTRKKEEEHKAQEKALQLKEQQEEEERKRRQEESVKAYEEWREKSKNRPKPATQGLFPHQAAKPAFINPTPWQKLIEDDSNVDQEDDKKRKIKRRKNNRKK